MMTIEEMKRIKKEKGYSYTQIAQMSGVPLGTVQKVFGGETANPRYDTLQALESLFNGESGTHPQSGRKRRHMDPSRSRGIIRWRITMRCRRTRGWS